MEKRIKKSILALVAAVSLAQVIPAMGMPMAHSAKTTIDTVKVNQNIGSEEIINLDNTLSVLNDNNLTDNDRRAILHVNQPQLDDLRQHVATNLDRNKFKIRKNSVVDALAKKLEKGRKDWFWTKTESRLNAAELEFMSRNKDEIETVSARQELVRQQNYLWNEKNWNIGRGLWGKSCNAFWSVVAGLGTGAVASGVSTLSGLVLQKFLPQWLRKPGKLVTYAFTTAVLNKLAQKKMDEKGLYHNPILDGLGHASATGLVCFGKDKIKSWAKSKGTKQKLTDRNAENAEKKQNKNNTKQQKTTWWKKHNK